MFLALLRHTTAALACCILLGGTAAAAVSISPALVEIALDRGRPAGQFVITNAGDEMARYRINAVHFVFGEDGNLKMVPPDRNSLAPWMKFNPRELSIPPQSNMVVRFTIVPKQKLDEREYWGAMELESLKANVAKSTDAAGRTMTLEVIPAIVVPVFGTCGKIRGACTISDIVLKTEVTPQVLETRVVNTGTGHLDLAGTVSIADAAGNVLEEREIDGAYVLAGSSRLFTRALQKPLPRGEYVIRVSWAAKRLTKQVVREVRGSW